MSENREELKDILKVEGINCKGFGIIPKAIMHDLDLPIEAKTIYSYFCSFAGNGTTAFPSRETILSHLKMTKDYYYKNFKLLVDQGFITVERSTEFPYKNTYTLISNPKKYEEMPPQYNKAYSQIKYSGLKAFGFGTIAKALMIDDRIDVKAKGIYSFFCSYAGSGIAAFPKKDKILFYLKLSENTYYKYLNELINCNYITIVQRKVENGKFSVNDYYLNKNPDILLGAKNQESEKAPYLNLQDNGTNAGITAFPQHDNKSKKSKNTKAPYLNLQDIKAQDITGRDITGQDTNINSTNINSFKNNQSINQPSEGASEDFLSQEDFSKIVYDEMVESHGIPYWYKEDKERLTTAVHILTNWGTVGYTDEMKKDIFELFNECLIEMACTDKMAKYRGCLVSYAKVIDKINESIKFGDNNEYMTIQPFVDEFISEYETASKQYEISSHVAYMKSCIWNCFQTYKVKLHSTVTKMLNGYYEG